ncbi:two-component system sensor histidine kinase KdpD [Methyloversatilis thermotolerans]|uniref:two-component system sensor histidine kinase KdpD n=1 Tax=Methyloversatilis thermotolerans TaxID=1346290 RepID=UPI000381598C|nr:two-component system sensor histidine kinase KdpD [Methyloversatilis thermotolerans]
MADDEIRPDPDALLALARAEADRAARGRLKIFFGSSAGVGKTWAMLDAAQRMRATGSDVVVGVAETHGRSDTARKLEGLELLLPRDVVLQGRTLKEFDLDAALARRPAVVLVDELAHSNAPGSRHPKRWQDVEELRDAGIDVWTTVNVQHIESLNDVVGGITGIRVRETVPDRVFDEASEVVLVDLPTDDLLRRLREGKIYLPEQAERAVRNFFRKGNLMALRELALRRTAERVEDDVRSYRRAHVARDSRAVWQVSDALLVCVGPGAEGDRLVRAAARRAALADAPWHAIYVETPALQRLPEARRRRILQTLKLAESLGATVATLAAEDIAAAVVAYAREHNLGTLVAGQTADRPLRAPWHYLPGRRPFARRVMKAAPEIELMLIARDLASDAAAMPLSGDDEASERTARRARGYAWAAGLCAAVTVLATPLLEVFDLANIVMLFLLAVVLTAVRFGRRAALASALMNVLAFDFFFVPPRFTFSVSDAQYLVTFAVMTVVGLVVGQLTASLQYQVNVARYREQRARGLFEMARDLGRALTVEQVCEIGEKAVGRAFRGHAAILLADDAQRLLPPDAGHGFEPDVGLAQWAYDHGEAAGSGTGTLPGAPALYLPLHAPTRPRGVLALKPSGARLLMIPEQRQLLDTHAALVAIAIERVHFVQVAQDTLLSIESERLRNSLLAALSHDLRTPLTALIGMSENLHAALARRGAGEADDASAILAQARRTAQLVANLLDMARLQAGAVSLHHDWLSLEELTGSALAALKPVLDRHVVHTDLPADLPLLYGDAVLLERVMANLLENAAKYTPPGSLITVSGRPEGESLTVEVSDDGPGLPAGDPDALFLTFKRGDPESSTPGVGLGLSICRAILRAHGGDIEAANRPPPARGAVFRWWLPLRAMPDVEAHL